MSAADTSLDVVRKLSGSSVQLKTLNEMESSKNALAMDGKSQPSRSISESSLSTTSSSTSSCETSKTTDSSLRLRNATTRKVNRSRSSTIAGASGGGGEDNTFDIDEKKLQENTNIAFSQLG